MIDYYNSHLKDIVPENLRDEALIALGHAVQKALQKLQDCMKASMLYASIEALPESILDLLAVEFRAQYYEQTMNVETKREIIAQTYTWYLRAGTPSVMEEFLATLFDGGVIYEWFSYNGDPYHFKVGIAVNEKSLTIEDDKKIKRQINICKNVRSWLESLFYTVHDAYHVAVEWEAGLQVCAEFYPKNNLAFHTLEGRHLLEGKKKLNGYDAEQSIDLYPLNLCIGSEVKAWADTKPRNLVINSACKVEKNYACGMEALKICYLDGDQLLDGSGYLNGNINYYEI